MKRLILISGLVSAVAIAAYVFTNCTTFCSSASKTAEEKEAAFSGKHSEGKKPQNISGAAAYLLSKRANPVTGVVSNEDVYNARRAAYRLTEYNKRNNVQNVGLEWQELGPNNVGGRTRGFLIDKDNTNKLYTGGVAGGIWTSDNGGDSWSRVPGSDTMMALAIGDIAQTKNGDIYAGTGEAIGGFPGEGIWKSTDGVNFHHLPSTSTSNPNNPGDEWAYVARIAADPVNPLKVYVAASGGLFITTDAGSTWTKAMSGNASEVQTGSDGVIFVVVNNVLYRSTDGGTTFDNLSNTMADNTKGPKSGGRFVLDIAPSDPNYVYVITIRSGVLGDVYQSKDQGDTWTIIGAGGTEEFDFPGDQGWYDLCIAVSPTDRETITVGGQTENWKWSDKNGWNLIANWQVHADRHAITFHPTNSDIMYISTDGGNYKTTNFNDKQPEFENKNNGYSVTQFYSIAAAYTGEVLGGTQDNGTQYINYSGNSFQYSRSVLGGDGGFAEISRINPVVMFAEHQNAAMRRSANGGSGFSSILDNNIDADANDTLDGGIMFINPFYLWEEPVYKDGELDISASYSRLFTVSGSQIWLYEGAATKLANAKWFRLGNIAGQAVAMQISEDGDHLFVGNTGGNLYRFSNIRDVKYSYEIINGTGYFSASDSGVTTTLISSISGHSINDIAIDRNDPEHIVVSCAQYNTSDYVYEIDNAISAGANGANRISIQNDLPPMPVYGVIIDANDYFGNTIVVGTELGIWGSKDGGLTWTEENNGMARVPVYRLRQERLYSDECWVMYAGTHGRGMFRSVSTTLGSCNTILGAPLTAKPGRPDNLKIYPNPMTQFSIVEIPVERAGDVNLLVYDIHGKVVKSLSQSIGTGAKTVRINREKMAPGVYIVSAFTGGKTYNARLVVQ